MIEAIMLTTGWLFWAIIGVIVVFDVLALSTEDEGLGGWAIFLTVAALILTVGFTDAFVGVKLTWLAIGVVAYCLIGVIWSFKKWFDFIVQCKRERPASGPPLVANNKSRVITSMALWPFQLIWWVLTWPRHFFVWAYNRLSTVYDRIAKHIWERA